MRTAPPQLGYAGILQFGGDPTKVFVAGHSAEGYLAAMIGMDAKWLAAHGLTNRQPAGIIPVRAQVSTHFTATDLRGETGPQLRPVVDEYAPLFHASKDLPPICLIVGGRELELESRVEENELLAVTLRNLGHPHVEFYEMGCLNHGSIAKGGMIVAHDFLQNVLKIKNAGE